MIQKMSDEHKIGFVDSIKQEDPTTVSPSKKEAVVADQKAKKLDNKDDGFKTNKHISSARTGVVSDIGGPNTYIKSQTSNTIWNNDKIVKDHVQMQSEAKALADQIVEAAKVQEEAAKVEKEESPKDNSSFSRLSDFKGTSYHIPSSGMSLFDTQDFQRLQEKTAGETLTEETEQKRSMKDESWKTNGKAKGTKEAINSLFDSLFKQDK